MSFDSSSIGMRIKHFRNLKHLSQEQLAEATGISREHVAKIEAGVNMPSLELFVTITNTLEITSDDLLSDNLKVMDTNGEKEYYEIFSDCNNDERNMLLKTLRFMKALLSEFGI